MLRIGKDIVLGWGIKTNVFIELESTQKGGEKNLEMFTLPTGNVHAVYSCSSPYGC